MIIANRVLKLDTETGIQDVNVRISIPRQDGNSWRCDYEITWPEKPRYSAGYGVDAIQALHLTLQKIGIDLYTSEAHAQSRLWFERRGSGYGFPIPKNGRDLLIGDDARFEG